MTRDFLTRDMQRCKMMYCTDVKSGNNLAIHSRHRLNWPIQKGKCTVLRSFIDLVLSAIF